MDINLTNPVTTAKIGEVVNGASAATPNDTDLLPVIESSVTKKLTLTNLKAFLKTYFDTLYSNLGYTAENVANKSSSYTLSSTTTYANTKALVDGLATKEPLKGSDDNYVTDAQLVVISNTSNTNSGNETAATIGAIVNGATDYPTPLDSDKFGIWDVANGLFKALTLANLKTTLAVLFGRHIFYMYSDTSSGNPLDNSVYYTSILNAVAVQTTNVIRFNSPKNSCIFGIQVGVYVTGTLGSSENTVVKLQNVTAGTEETLNALQHNKRYNQSYTISTLANMEGDEMVVQITNPAWATNPLSCQYQFTTFGY